MTNPTTSPTTTGADVPEEKSSAQEHLERSKELSEQARQSWEDLPETQEADDDGVRGEQGHQAPAD